MSGEATKPAIQPESPKRKDGSKPAHGRRAANEDDDNNDNHTGPRSGWTEQVKQPIFGEQQTDVNAVETVESMVRPGESDVPTNADQIAMTDEAQEELEREVAPAPVDYHSKMPKLAELEAHGGGRMFAETMQRTEGAGDIDLSALTGVLCAQLDDEDEPWVPDILLVQLTSELLDVQAANNANGDGEGEEEAASLTLGESVAGGQQHRSSVNLTASTGGNLRQRGGGGSEQASASPSEGQVASGGPSPTANGPSNAGSMDMGVSAAGRRRGVA